MSLSVLTEPLAESPTSEQASNNVLFGRYMRPDRQEFPCQISNIDTSQITLITTGERELGETIVAYIDEIGRIEGKVIHLAETGFTIGLSLSGAQLERIQKRLEWIENPKDAENPNQRRHARYQPSETSSQLILPDGRTYPGEIVDISISGAAVRVDVIPAIGTYVMLGKMRGRVTRIHGDGIGIEFVKMLDTAGLKNSFNF